MSALSSAPGRSTRGHRAAPRGGTRRAPQRGTARVRLLGGAALALALLGGAAYGSLHVLAAGGSDRGGVATDDVAAPADRTGAAGPAGGAVPGPAEVAAGAGAGAPQAPPTPGTAYLPAPVSSTAPPAPPATSKEPRQEAARPGTPGAAATGVAGEVLVLTNAERARAGCGPLTVDSRLTVAANGHSADMAANDYFSHTSRNGAEMADRVDAAGYDWRAIGENIAMGQRTPAAVMSAWMNSKGHRENILNCGFRNIGIGVAYAGSSPVWTQDFGTPR